jgi:hypothetical protein
LIIFGATLIIALMCRVLGIHNTMNMVVNTNRRHLLLSKFIPKTRKNLNWGPPFPQVRFMVLFMASYLSLDYGGPICAKESLDE